MKTAALSRVPVPLVRLAGASAIILVVIIAILPH
jgi:hypothetical protein